MEDTDRKEDDMRYPDAAGMEPAIVIFGPEFESKEAAEKFIKTEVGPWCTDLVLDAVDMYEWLWPTEVDPDAITEEHRTSHAGSTGEQNKIMKQRKKTMEQTAEARATAAALKFPLKEVNANAVELPDVREVIAKTKPGMYLTGPVMQYDVTCKECQDCNEEFIKDPDYVGFGKLDAETGIDVHHFFRVSGKGCKCVQTGVEEDALFRHPLEAAAVSGRGLDTVAEEDHEDHEGHEDDGDAGADAEDEDDV